MQRMRALARQYKRNLIIIIAVVILIVPFIHSVKSSALSKTRNNVADRIADICIEEYNTYGILPSVAVGQAFVESGLYSGPNLFGVNGCSGLSVEAATYRYLQCLHNGYFKGTAAFKESPSEQMYYILEKGNYCEGEYPYGRYYYNVLRSIYRYGWDKYDSRLKSYQKAERRKKATRLRRKRQKQPFRILVETDLPAGTCIADKKYILRGSTVIFENQIVECVDNELDLGNTIRIGVDVDDNNFRDISKFLENCTYVTKLKEVIENGKG